MKNNPKKFLQGYILELTEDESAALWSNFLTIENDGIKTGRYSKYRYKAFTEKGLYMLATILKSDQATETTVAIIETFALVRHMARMMNSFRMPSMAEMCRGICFRRQVSCSQRLSAAISPPNLP